MDLGKTIERLKGFLARAVGAGAERAQPSSDATAMATGASTIVQGSNNATATDRSVAVGKDVHGNVIVINAGITAESAQALLAQLGSRQRAPDMQQATAEYLRFLLDRYRFLELRGMGVSDRVPVQLPLLEMYVPLYARAGLPEGDTWSRERVGTPLLAEDRGPEPEARRAERVSLLNLLAGHDGLILLGDPGAGKTTFIKFLALVLASGQGSAVGLPGYLPVLLPLSAYATACEREGRRVRLDVFIADYYRESVGNWPLEEMLTAALEAGHALLLLDGLDEVRETAKRQDVMHGIADFYGAYRRQGNRFVLTSRLTGYPEVRPVLDKVAECTLLDLDDEDIALFVDKWTAALERAASGDTRVAAQAAADEKEELLGAIRRHPGVRGLASNPLLLTILALMKRQGIALPERRVELYQTYVDSLLRHWNLARSLGRPQAPVARDEVETLRTLAPLALWMQETAPGRGLVAEADICERLAAILGGGGPPAEAQARELLRDVREETGLLVYRGGRQYGFLHLTFQEYLAAVALGRTAQKSVQPLIDILAEHVGDPTWREVSLLSIGYLGIIQGRDEAASDVLYGLLERAPGKPGEAVLLAGEAVRDTGPSGVTRACLDRVRSGLLAAMREGEVPATRRVACGKVLGHLGDPRPGVLGVDAMEFCRVPAGPFFLGSPEDDDLADMERESPAGIQELDYEYLLGRYPVTLAQFRAYADAAGKERNRYWGDLVSEPVVAVTFFEALDFCRWLTRRWAEAGRLPAGWRVGLPSELEWEKAARGGLRLPSGPVPCTIDNLGAADDAVDLIENRQPKRRFPWGHDPDTELANFDLNIGETSPAGCFPAGASPYGCEDMAGNVLEWTRSHWADYPYPESPEARAEREDLSSKNRRVLRGGAFINSPRSARCASRAGYDPGFRGFSIGFRVVVSPFFPER